jgi:hypothetical protein
MAEYKKKLNEEYSLALKRKLEALNEQAEKD